MSTESMSWVMYCSKVSFLFYDTKQAKSEKCSLRVYTISHSPLITTHILGWGVRGAGWDRDGGKAAIATKQSENSEIAKSGSFFHDCVSHRHLMTFYFWHL